MCNSSHLLNDIFLNQALYFQKNYFPPQVNFRQQTVEHNSDSSWSGNYNFPGLSNRIPVADQEIS